jgi:hydrogenase maturation protease
VSGTREGRRVLVAGIGNVFLGDDGFGVEVVSRLRERALPETVEVGDYGIRGFDLAYALMEDYDAAILVDALPLDREPGELAVLEPDLEELDGFGMVEGHGMNPVEVFRLVKQLGGRPPKVLLIVGCQPGTFGPENEGQLGLSEPVAASVEPAAALIESLVARIGEMQEVR